MRHQVTSKHCKLPGRTRSVNTKSSDRPSGGTEGHHSVILWPLETSICSLCLLSVWFWVQAACRSPWTSLVPEPPAPRHVGSRELGSVFCYCDHDRSIASKGLVTWRPGPVGGSSMSHSQSRIHLLFFTCWIAHRPWRTWSELPSKLTALGHPNSSSPSVSSWRLPHSRSLLLPGREC